jgi:hypothetical protein
MACVSLSLRSQDRLAHEGNGRGDHPCGELLQAGDRLSEDCEDEIIGHLGNCLIVLIGKTSLNSYSSGMSSGGENS